MQEMPETCVWSLEWEDPLEEEIATHFSILVLEKTLESPLDCKEIQPVHSEGDQPWDFFGRNDAKTETPILWPPHAKSLVIGKDSDAGRDWGQDEKGTTEDEMAGWHHWLDGRESGWALGVGDGQGGLACCDSWVCKESDDWVTDLIWSDLISILPWITPSTEEPGRLRSMGLQRVGHNWATEYAHTHTHMLRYIVLARQLKSYIWAHVCTC